MLWPIEHVPGGIQGRIEAEQDKARLDSQSALFVMNMEHE